MTGDLTRELIHVWQHCHACGAAPIVGRRYDCLVCPAGPDMHLCDACYQSYRRGAVVHPSAASVNAHQPAGPHEFQPAEGRPWATYEPWLRVADGLAGAPEIPEGVVVRPEFGRGPRSFLGSYAFIVDLGDGRGPLLLTALHVLDELAKDAGIDCGVTNAAYTGEELPRIVDRVHVYDVYAAKWMFADVGTARSMLRLPDARIGEKEPACQGDVAAFVMDPSSARTHALRLASRAPDVGEPLWLAAPCGAGRERTVAATVVERSAGALIFRFADGSANPPRTSGAPLVNDRGDVVGLNVGGGYFVERRYGHGVHVDSIRQHLCYLTDPHAAHRYADTSTIP